MRKKFTWSNISTALLALLLVAVIFSPRAKSWLIMGLMMLGFFKPDIPQIKPGEKFEPLPAMQVQSADGEVIDLQQRKGKVIFINFWATWCAPCLAEMPSVNALYEKVKNNPNIIFLAVDVDNNLQKSSKFLLNKGYQFPAYGGDAAHVPDKLFGNGIPTTLVADKKGNIVFTHFNRANYDNDEFVKFLTDLAKE